MMKRLTIGRMAGLALIAGTFGSAGCQYISPVESQRDVLETKQTPTLEQMQEALGYRWTNLSANEQSEFKTYWDNFNFCLDKDQVFEIYSCAPFETLAKLREAERETYQSLNYSEAIRNLNADDHFPWLGKNQETPEDRLLVTAMEITVGLSGSLNSR